MILMDTMSDTKGDKAKEPLYKKYADEASQFSDNERDTPRIIPLPPQKIELPTKSPIVQISCGMHHTVALSLAGEVFTFGSNQYGQLGESQKLDFNLL